LIRQTPARGGSAIETMCSALQRVNWLWSPRLLAFRREDSTGQQGLEAALLLEPERLLVREELPLDLLLS
jgi:hypothetical protein